MSKYWHQLLMLMIILASLFFDTLSKSWAHANLLPGVRYIFIPKLLNFTLITNTGFAFSIGQGHENIAKIIATAVFITLLLVYIKRYVYRSEPISIAHVDTKEDSYFWLEQLGMSLIIGSAMGNLLERFSYGRVTDFVEFAFISFPIFNVADALIDVGVVLIFISLYCAGKKTKK